VKTGDPGGSGQGEILGEAGEQRATRLRSTEITVRRAAAQPIVAIVTSRGIMASRVAGEQKAECGGMEKWINGELKQ
jgi:hypothetical protein